VTEATARLPLELTELVGRSGEVEQICMQLSRFRLVTVVGPGGVGKTRVALAVAERLDPGVADEVWWVDLGAVTDSRLLASTVAASLDVHQAADQGVESALVDHLGSRAAVIVLDNCEQLVSDCARLVEALLRSCPEIRVVATSREVIGVPGESVFRLRGLATSGNAAAIQLFKQRASMVDPRFATSGGDEAVTELCRALDGLPLAIELAAARVNVLAIDEIVERLRQDQRILRNSSRHAAPRHQTLEATLDWSYRLLSPTEQVVFRRLSVFRGSFSLAAAESVSVCPGMDQATFVDVFGWLVDKSLVHVSESETGAGTDRRYRLLETVRYFAYELLATPFETSATHDAHLTFFIDLARQGGAELDGRDQARWLHQLSVEHDNLSVALGWAHSCSAAESLGQLTGVLWPFWYRRGLYDEARTWMERAVALLGEMDEETRAATLTGAGVLAFLQCDYSVATQRLTAARGIYASCEDRGGLATVLQRLGSVARERGDYPSARSLHGESRSLWEAIGHEAGVATSDDYLGFVSWLDGDLDGAELYSRRALEYFSTAGLRQETAAARVNLGAAAYHRADVTQASDELRGALDISSAIGYQEGIAWSLHFLGAIGTSGGNDDGPQMLQQALSIHMILHDWWRTASVLETVAVLCQLPSDARGGARLLAACDALRRHLGAPLPPVEASAVEDGLRAARAALSRGEFEDAWSEGSGAPVEQAVSWAIEALDAVVHTPTQSSNPGGAADAGLVELTPRELDVLDLVRAGLTNREIGRALYISAGTAGVHVSNILRKLGLTSRVQAAALAERARLGGPTDHHE
jgi:predicted ATPase/DNA-binding NarL/FixJ family response regulator